MNVKATDFERIVLDHLIQAWNGFIQLPDQHPDDQTEFRQAIHVCQCLIAYRVAKRVDPELWGSDRPARRKPTSFLGPSDR